MKKFLRRIVEMMIAFSCLFYNFCYADVIDPIFPRTPSTPRVPEPDVPEPIIESPEKIVPLVVVGIVVVIVVVAVVFILEEKGKGKREKRIKIQNKR